MALASVARLLECSLGELTLPQFRVLALVEAWPERAGRLAAVAGVSRPSLTGVLDGLVARGWVRRSDVDGDRRGVRLEITADGRRALDGATSGAADQLGDLAALLDADDRKALRQGFAALGRAVDAHRKERAALAEVRR
jgi:long-chain acyl-CoA synthetase